uniref:Cilia- and flagella-associated protein 299 n=1 Tax=Sander lucioperca TaxID=283035 RepID=A0A8C9XH26_SANLU
QCSWRWLKSMETVVSFVFSLYCNFDLMNGLFFGLSSAAFLTTTEKFPNDLFTAFKINISNRLSVVFSRTLASAGKELKDNFLKALAEREEANRSGKMTSVIFIRDHNTLGQEVSGYIDYAHRLKTQDFEPYFSGKKRLMPGRSDLCYYNWKTQVSTSNSSPNFEVIYDDPNGLLFKNKRDKKILNVDPLVGLCCYCCCCCCCCPALFLSPRETNGTAN